MEHTYFFAVDLGATSGRTILGCLGEGKMELKELTRFPNHIIETGGHCYWDIYALYNEIIRGLKVVAKDNLPIRSIGIDTWGVDFVFVGKDGELLRNPYCYRDPHTTGAPEEYFTHIPRERVYDITGIQIMNFNSLFQLSTLHRNHCSALEVADKILFMPDALSYMLTGKMVTEYTIASTSQMLNPRTKRFEKELLDVADIKEEQLLNILKSKDWKTITLLHDKLIKILREYYFVGGMPEAVKTYLATNDATLVRQVQNNILTIYRSDMSKHVSPNEATRISMVWQSIPSQLAKENKKFIYGAVRSGARAKDFEMAIQWLVDAGLTYRISRVREVGMPLKFYEDLNAFKLFLLDVGLLGALSEMEPAQMLISNKAMTESKGAFTENYVLTQLLCQQDIYTYYYSREDARLEIDFLAQHQGVITPIEVKAEENLRSKSLRAFFDAHPDLRAIRFSMSPYKEQEWMKNVPLYGVEESF